MFRLPEEVKKDIENYEAFLHRFQEGEINEARFKGIRVPWGIYSHRGGKVFMNRIRIPAGVLTPSQLKALASASQKYGDGNLHITTRQDIQIHNVEIEDTIKLMEELVDYELSPRGGGGNTVRNIIACPFSGVCKEEVFEVRRFAVALSEYLLRQDSSYNLPRKFKIAFSGCRKDCAGVLVNDVGFLPQTFNGKKGFKVFVGGGMGADSRVGVLLEEFLPREDVGYCVTAIKNIFYKHGDRRDKHHNRLRFLIHDNLGFDRFRNLYREEYRRLKENEYIVLRKVNFPGLEEEDSAVPKVDDVEFADFLKYNVHSQKQRGFSIVELRIPQGDIFSRKAIELAKLEEEFKGIEFRTTQNQNLALVWVKNESLYKLFLKLKDILSDFLYPQTLLDVVACRGALTCNLGLCNSPGLARAIEEKVKEFKNTKAGEKLEIRLNGCPNACGQHPVGKISFYGIVRRVDSRAVPFYKILVGGRKQAEETVLAQEVGILPAKNIPEFLRDFLKKAEEVLKEGEDIYHFLQKKGKEIIQEVIEDYKYVPPYTEDRNFYIDWGRKEEFSLAGLGPGECGAGVLDMIEADLAEARIALEKAEEKGYSPEELKKALFLSARALLVVRGSDPTTPQEAFADFKKIFIAGGIASSRYSDVDEVFASINESIDEEERRKKFVYAKEFFEHINKLYESMDSSFNFPKEEEKKGLSSGVEETKERGAHFLDLKGTPCPLNYVKVKLALEKLAKGDSIEVLLDEGEPIENVPRSLENDGHKILEIKKLDGFYKVVIEKNS